MLRQVALALLTLFTIGHGDGKEPLAEKGLALTEPTTGRSVKTDAGWMVSYQETIPGTDVTFEMLPIPGGVVRLPLVDAADESTFCEVGLPPYWAAKCEVTWAEYRRYMALDSEFAKLQQLSTQRAEPRVAAAVRSNPALTEALSKVSSIAPSSTGVDAVTAPTPLYDPSTTYESGEDGRLPAVTMSPFAARQYTKWLSALTGRDYRLPSEAEWLHAASAGGSVEPSSLADLLDEVAWFEDNSDYVAQHVGQKAPNEWGLHDTLGNAAELVLDAAKPSARSGLEGKRVAWHEAIAWPANGESRIAKGGWYDAEAEEINFTGRMVTEEDDWRSSDPNLPRSPWWYSDYPATGVGFRLVRPLQRISEEMKARVWDTQDTRVEKAVAERLREGRGKLGPIDSDLPAVLDALNSKPIRSVLE